MINFCLYFKSSQNFLKYLILILQNFDFKSIQVETPVVLVVNGRKLGREKQASVKISTFKKND